MIGIYKITSPTGKIYVGQSVDISRRKQEHSKFSYKNNYQSKLYASIQKYGWENHIFEVIEECEESELNNREGYWQDFYNSVSREGLNLIRVNDKDRSGYFSEELRQKFRVPRPSISGDNNPMRIYGGHFGEANGMYGKKHSEETRAKIKKNRRGISGQEVHNARLILCQETGIFYYSCNEASKIVGCSHQHLSDMLTEKIKNKTSLIYV